MSVFGRFSVKKPDAPFPVHEAHRLCKDLFRPNPSVYWADFLFHAILGWAAFAFTLRAEPFSATQAAGFTVAVFAVFRAAIFIHELAHLKRGTFGAFRWVWNLLIGFPFLLPSLTYQGVHYEHHRQAVYGTKRDGEYYPFVTAGLPAVLAFLAGNFLFPAATLVRFLLLTPLSWVLPPLRRFLWKRFSSLVIDPSYVRPDPQPGEAKSWALQETFCFAYAWGGLALMASGVLPWSALLLWYALEVSVLFLNAVRTLAAHRYVNPEDRPLELWQQFLDSVTVVGNPVTTELWAPVGLRYHAVHHLFPSLPYHNLGEAHRRLLREFGDTTPYRETLRKNLFDALGRLFRDIREARRLRLHSPAFPASAGPKPAEGGC